MYYQLQVRSIKHSINEKLRYFSEANWCLNTDLTMLMWAIFAWQVKYYQDYSQCFGSATRLKNLLNCSKHINMTIFHDPSRMKFGVNLKHKSSLPMS